MSTTKIEKLEQKAASKEELIKKLMAEVKEEKAAAKKLRKAEEAAKAQARRKADTGRKVLLGALLLKWCKEDPKMLARVQKELDEFLVRPTDKRRFEGVDLNDII